MERLIIHLGLHKTGTTAVQGFLESNSEDLLKRGAAYISLDRMRLHITPMFHEMDEQKRDAARRLFKAASAPSLILSDENIAGGVDDVLAGAFYPAARDKLMSVLELLEHTPVHLVLALRNPVDLIPALYSEYVRLHDFISFDAYVAKLDLPAISFWETFGWMQSLPRNITTHIVPFEERFGPGVPGVAATILRAALGSSVTFDMRTFYDFKVRTSFTMEEIELATVIAKKSSGNVARLFLRAIDENGARFGEQRYSPLEPSVAAVLSQRYEQDLARFGVWVSGR